ncbi:MAG: adenylate/guanylate cyclase domain-containing protein, partial [Acidobacteria bacterium]|nr:adenylate/guanylate cyclase domain-containing protein [Acidobacteriota bacterium]
LVNFHGKARTYPYVSMGKVVTGDFPPDTFKDKLVLVGASATGIGDLRATPFSKLDFPGVEIHANVIDNILNNNFIERGGKQVLLDLFFILLFGVPVGLWLGRVQPRFMWLALVLLVPFFAIVYYAFLKGWWLNAVTPALTLVSNVTFVGLYRVIAVEIERRRTQSTFQQYMSPEVVRRLLKDPDLVKPRKIDITIMFTDVRGFTTLAEDLDAQEVAHLLNHYLSEMTRIVFQHQGTLDKYMGDGMMAFWGAPFDEPDHAPKACRSGLGMLEKLKELQREWQAEGKPRMDIGIGIHTGVASVGNMGSQLRYGYTVVGDAVNLSSRLEGMNKLYGTRILVSEGTRLKAQASGLLFREVDWIRVTGKKQHVTIYELPTAGDDRAGWMERIEIFENGLRLFRRRDWSTAYSLFEQLLQRWPEDGPAQLFLGRCEEYLVSPPSPVWDGIYTAKQK